MFSFFRRLWMRIKNFFNRDDDPRNPFDPGDYVDYYGCPNSKRARELQLGKKPLSKR